MHAMGRERSAGIGKRNDDLLDPVGCLLFHAPGNGMIRA